MTLFVDTSVLYAFLDADDDGHASVLAQWERNAAADVQMVTTNYVLMEAAALCQNRLGLGFMRDLLLEATSVLQLEWVDRVTHEAGVAAVLAANRRDLSLVDCVSFEVMRRLGIQRAFTLDEHFREQGFDCVP